MAREITLSQHSVEQMLRAAAVAEGALKTAFLDNPSRQPTPTELMDAWNAMTHLRLGLEIAVLAPADAILSADEIISRMLSPLPEPAAEPAQKAA